MNSSCLFCKIIAGSIPGERILETPNFVAIRDINPQAKAHALVLPRKHLASLAEAFPEAGSDESELMGEMLAVGAQVARKLGLLPGGFRSVINTNGHAGQTVFHVHLHILGGEPLGHFGR